MSKYDECATKVKNALDYTYEEKSNKKDSLDNDYSTDTNSYPTCKAVNTELSNKISKSSTAGLVKNDGTIDTTQYLSSLPSHTHEATEVTDDNSANYTNMGTLSANATQQSINNAINTQLGSLLNIDLIVVVASLPTASEDTMNKMYLVAESTPVTQDTYEVYITVRTGTSPNYSYDWEKVDTARIDLTNYIEKSLTTGLIKNDGTVDTTTYEDNTNKVTSISSSSTDIQYPTAKLLYDQLQTINRYLNILANFTLTTTPQIISYYHNQTATLTATLLKGNGNGVTGETIKFYKDNTELTGTVTDNGDGTYTYTLPSTNTGLHTLQAKNDILTTDNITLLDASYYDDTTTDKHTDYYNITSSGVYVTYNDGYYTLTLGTGNNYVDIRKALDINGKTVSFSVDVVLNGASVRLRAFHSGGTPIVSSSYTTTDGTITLEDIEIPSDATGTIFRLERRYTTDGDYIQFKNFTVYVTP